MPNTLRHDDGMISGVVFRTLHSHHDDRGWLVELFRHDELDEQHHPRMAYVSQTAPGKSRGPHAHADQTDLFAFIGPGDLKLYLWDARGDSPTYGRRQIVIVGESNPQSVVVPPGVVHGYKNIGSEPAIIYNFPNRLYRGPGKIEAVDETRFEETAESPFQFD